MNADAVVHKEGRDGPTAVAGVGDPVASVLSKTSDIAAVAVWAALSAGNAVDAAVKPDTVEVFYAVRDTLMACVVTVKCAGTGVFGYRQVRASARGVAPGQAAVGTKDGVRAFLDAAMSDRYGRVIRPVVKTCPKA